MSTEVMTKLHQGEFIKQLQEKARVKYREIREGINKSERTIQVWEKQPQVSHEAQTLISTFYGIDIRAFVNPDVREKELARIKPKHVKPMVEEEQVPYQVQEINRKLDKVTADHENFQKMYDEMLRILRQMEKKKK